MDVEYVDIVIFHIKRGGENIIKLVYENKGNKYDNIQTKHSLSSHKSKSK